MRIALCLSGQPRGIPLSINMLKSVLDVSNMDVFCHVWFDENTIGQPYDSAQYVQAGRVGKVHPETKEIILNELNPVECMFETPRQFPYTRNFRSIDNADQNKMASIFYSIYTANMLKRKYEYLNDFTYDLVIRARYDLVYSSEIDIMKYVEQAKTHIVTAEKFQGLRNDPNYIHGWYTMTDIFAMSSSKNMDVFSSTYPYMSYINTKIEKPYGENYIGYRVRVMGGLETYCVPEWNYEIMHRVVDLSTI